MMEIDKKLLDEILSEAKHRKEKHCPYSQSWGEPDFEVEYVIDVDSDLKGVKLKQGIRTDFLYEGDEPLVDGVYMIWPEFLDENGDVILDASVEIKKAGRANMWIGMREMNEAVHRKRIHVGVVGYMVIGAKKVARVRVTKVVGLH